MRGAAKNDAHASEIEEPSEIPKVCMDFWLMTEEDKKERKNLVLTVTNKKTKQQVFHDAPEQEFAVGVSFSGCVGATQGVGV